jgi:thiol:disulfide interchange protein
MNFPHVNVDLISDQHELVAMSSFRAGIHFRLEKGWHIYWQNPGDSGAPPQIQWSLPSGIQAGPILWPAPQHIQVGPLVNYGYENDVLLPVAFQINPSFLANKLPLKANVSWLVCSDICIPGKASLRLDIPMGDSSEDSQWKPLFEKAQDSLPVTAPASWDLKGTLDKDSFHLSAKNLDAQFSSVAVFPLIGDEVDNSAQPVVSINKTSFQYQIKRSDRLTNNVSDFPAVVVLHNASGAPLAFHLDFALSAPSVVTAASGAIALSLFFAFVGGLLLNLMPCVFPVLSIKVMSIMGMSGEQRTNVRKMGVAYSLGILVSFWALVAGLLLLRIGGRQIGWGFQLQSPKFVLVLACVLFIFGLNLLGMFEIGGSFTGAGSSLANKKGLLGSFFTGVLATLVATPCSAPFMGSAVGFALTQTPFVVFLIFTMIAVGLALPYLLISFIPEIGRYLPKPGVWMETFKELMSFLIFGTVIWLAWVLSLQASISGVMILLCAFLGIGFAAWIAFRWNRSKFASRLAWVVGAFVIAGSAYVVKPMLANAVSGVTHEDGLVWEKFSPEKLAEYRSKGQPVFLDFTAAWCVSCQVNEMVVFHNEEVRQKLRDSGVILMKADWTNEDPVITKMLASFGRNGVPFYVIYGKEKDAPADPLPEIINAGIVLRELEKLK